MGLFDFVKDAGEKIFGRDKEETMGDKEREAKAAQGKELMDERRKAASIVDFVNGLNLKVENLSVKVDDSTATVSGKVPSHEEREKVVLAVGNTRGIAKVDDRLDVSGQAVSASDNSDFYTVKSGDTLSGIAKAHYGNSGEYMRIFEANRPMLKDPDKIYPGQTLRIPAKG